MELKTNSEQVETILCSSRVWLLHSFSERRGRQVAHFVGCIGWKPLLLAAVHGGRRFPGCCSRAQSGGFVARWRFQTSPMLFPEVDSKGRTALHYNCAGGSAQARLCCLWHALGMVPLWSLHDKGQRHIVTSERTQPMRNTLCQAVHYLLQHGATVDLLDRSGATDHPPTSPPVGWTFTWLRWIAGSTPLHWAARYGHAPIVRCQNICCQCSCSHGKNKQHCNNGSAQFLLIGNLVLMPLKGKFHKIYKPQTTRLGCHGRLLLESKAHPDYQNSMGDTAMHEAGDFTSILASQHNFV